MGFYLYKYAKLLSKFKEISGDFMIKKLKYLSLIILLGLILSACQKESSAIYYVSTNGNDSNSGSLEEPFKTIQQAADVVISGDKVMVREGTYHEKINISTSGKKNSPIIFMGYKEERPIIDGTGVKLKESDEKNGLISIKNQSNITIQGFDIQNFISETEAVPSGIRVSGSGENIQIIDVKVSNIKTDYRENDLEEANAHGIAFYGTGKKPLKNILIKNSEVFQNQLGLSEAVVLNGNISHFEVTNNKIHDNDNIGLDFIGFEEISKKNDQARDGVVTNNRIFNNSSKNNPTYYGETSAGGIYVDGGKNIKIENNEVYQNDIGIEVASEHKGKVTSKITVSKNQVYGNLGFAGISFGGYDENRGSAKEIIIEENELKENQVDIIVQSNAQYSSNKIINNKLGSVNQIEGDLSNIIEENNQFPK